MGVMDQHRNFAQAWVGACLVGRGGLLVLAGMRRFGCGVWEVLWGVGRIRPGKQSREGSL